MFILLITNDKYITQSCATHMRRQKHAGDTILNRDEVIDESLRRDYAVKRAARAKFHPRQCNPFVSPRDKLRFGQWSAR